MRSAPCRLMLVLSIAAGGCADAPTHWDPAPPDMTSASLSPRDMNTHVARQLLWDETAQMPVFGPVVLEVALHNSAGGPTDAEIDQVLARTELTTWPEAEQVEYEEVERNSTGRQRRVVTLVSTERLENRWYALRVLEDSDLAASDELGRALLSRFHPGSCPLLLSVEAYRASSGLTLVLSETLDGAVLLEMDVSSLDGSSRCVPDFSGEGPLSPGKRLHYSCDFNATREGLRIEVPPSNPIWLPSDGHIRADEFMDGSSGPNSSQKFYRAVTSEADEMPVCKD